MGAFARLVGPNGILAKVTGDGRLMVDTAVTVNGTSNNAKGSPDNGTTWLPVKTDADGNLFVKFPEGFMVDIKKIDTPMPEKYPTLRRLSTETEPIANDDDSPLVKYQLLWIMDTDVMKRWSGTAWVVMP